MKTKKVTKRALLMSALALMICVSMLVGSTYAWFSDTVTSGGNIIKSGTLDIDLGIKADGDADYVLLSADPAKKAFDYDLWEPGYTAWVNAKVMNNGTLALKYTMRIVANGDASILADVIDVYYKPAEVAKPANRDLSGLTRIGTLADVMSTPALYINDHLLAGEEAFATLALHMQETAGNEYQNLSIGSDFSLQILATQYTYERDSFDDQYDVNANGTPDNENFPNFSNIYAFVETPGAPTSVGDTNEVGHVEVDFPEGALDDDVTKVSLITDTISDNDAVITVDTSSGAEASYFDISLVDQDGNPIEIQNNKVVPVQKNVGTYLLITEVNHRNTVLLEGEANANANGEYYTYNEETGILTLYVTGFSPFSMGYATDWAEMSDGNGGTILLMCGPDGDIGSLAIEKACELSEAACGELLNILDLDKVMDDDMWGFAAPESQRIAIATVLIGGWQGVGTPYYDSAILDACIDGTTVQQVKDLQAAYAASYGALIDSVDFGPDIPGSFHAWSPYFMGGMFGGDIGW